IVGGPFAEPILTMIPPRDRRGQIRRYTECLQHRFGAAVRGMWVPERVWEQSVTADLVDAGIEYTVLDDFHFRNAGCSSDLLHGYFVTEDNGRLLKVFPGSERLRYLIPFGKPEETIEDLREMGERHPGAVAVFGDDGEKFGTWPETKQHVYDDGWLRSFFDALVENGDWLETATLSSAVDQTAPLDKIYLPDASYREMTEWVLPVDRHLDYETTKHEFQESGHWRQVEQFVRGGFWRNFKVRYPEADEMYARMMMVSQRLERLEQDGLGGGDLEQARAALYRGQCNCSYWHGAFGGIYLPHLRNAVYANLIEADNLLDQFEGKSKWVEARADDFNFDGRPEVRLENDRFVCLLAPAAGGRMYEFDIRRSRHNLLATLTRQPEAYHRKVLAGATDSEAEDVASIHDRVVFKQDGLDQRLQYDRHLRKSLVDHFYDNDATLESVANGQALERGDFVDGAFETTIRRNDDRVQVMMTRPGNAWGRPLTITKGVTLESGSSELEVAYRIDGLAPDEFFHFAVEFNFAGLPSGADDRYFYAADRQRLGHLGAMLDLYDQSQLGMVDQWLGVDAQLGADRPTHFWTFPIESVSQSEGGFELVHQSLVVMPHWLVKGDADGRWGVTMRLQVETEENSGSARQYEHENQSPFTSSDRAANELECSMFRSEVSRRH
ncbi:MAG: DUF1926 domain-containing protein, partial [Pirellulaceae bacterium]|nr:DUF1926 domain-containing protein [Pirellulaceae bacterium]